MLSSAGMEEEEDGPREVICTRTLKPEKEKMGKIGEMSNF